MGLYCGLQTQKKIGFRWLRFAMGTKGMILLFDSNKIQCLWHDFFFLYVVVVVVIVVLGSAFDELVGLTASTEQIYTACNS